MPVYKSIVAGATKQFYDPGQSRDEAGRFASTGAGGKATAKRPIGRSVGEARRKAREIAGDMGLSMASPTVPRGRQNIAAAIRASRAGDPSDTKGKLRVISALKAAHRGELKSLFVPRARESRAKRDAFGFKIPKWQREGK